MGFYTSCIRRNFKHSIVCGNLNILYFVGLKHPVFFFFFVFNFKHPEFCEILSILYLV